MNRDRHFDLNWVRLTDRLLRPGAEDGHLLDQVSRAWERLDRLASSLGPDWPLPDEHGR